MAYPNGFSYVKGPRHYVWSTVASTATFRARNPVTLDTARNVIEATSASTAIYGIAMNDAASSLGGVLANRVLVEIPTADTVYAVKTATGVAASALSIGQAYNIAKSGNHLRIDAASQSSPRVVIVPRDAGSTILSDDSSVLVHWLGDVLGVFSSNVSFVIFA